MFIGGFFNAGFFPAGFFPKGPEEGFELQRSPDGVGSWVSLAYVDPSTLTFSDVGLPASTQFFYRCRRIVRGDMSGFSNIDDATTDPPP